MTSMFNIKEFFGFGPVPNQADEYYDDTAYSEPQYAQPRSTASYSAPVKSVAAVVPVTVNNSRECTKLGEPFRDGDVVVTNLGYLPQAEAQRCVDFMAGLSFALRGEVKKIEGRIFALIPDRVTVSDLDLRRAVETLR